MTITRVTQNGTALILATNSFNKPPAYEYVLVDYTATYRGVGTGDVYRCTCSSSS